MADKTKLYKRAEVAETTKGEKSVVIIENKVYDVTQFLNDHPGGEEVLRDHAGIDATEDFLDIGHSGDALELMQKYLVGELVESERTNIQKRQKIPQQEDQQTQEQQGEPIVPLTLIAIAVFVVFVAAAIYLKGL